MEAPRNGEQKGQMVYVYTQKVNIDVLTSNVKVCAYCYMSHWYSLCPVGIVLVPV